MWTDAALELKERALDVSVGGNDQHNREDRDPHKKLGALKSTSATRHDPRLGSDTNNTKRVKDIENPDNGACCDSNRLVGRFARDSSRKLKRKTKSCMKKFPSTTTFESIDGKDKLATDSIRPFPDVRTLSTLVQN
jgi:hypothetical protein